MPTFTLGVFRPNSRVLLAGAAWLYHAGALADGSLRAPTAIDGFAGWPVIALAVALFVFALGVGIRITARSHKRPSHAVHHPESKWLNAMEFVDEPVVLVDTQDRIMRGNPAYYRTIASGSNNCGTNNAPLAGEAAAQYCHPAEQTACPVCEARRKGQDATLILETQDPTNPFGRPMEIRLWAVNDSNGNTIGMLQHNRDLSHTRDAEMQLRKSEAQFRALLESTPDPLIISDSKGEIIFANQRCEAVLGYCQTDLVGKSIEILVPEAMRHTHVSLRQSYERRPTARPLGKGRQLTAQCKNGAIIPVDISLSPLKIDNEFFISAIMRDVSEQKRYERELKRLASFPRLSPMPIIELHYDEKGVERITYLNPRAEFLFPDLAEKSDSHDILLDLQPYVERAKLTGQPQTRVIKVGDQVYEQQVSFVNEVEVAHITLWDMTAMHQLTSEMTYQASHDSLTGLVNRAEFERRILAALQQAESEDKQHAFCFIDLDRFKIVNDQCGHAAGDALLKQLAKIIKAKIRSSDTLARLGGDEFGLLLEGCEINRALRILENIQKDITAYRYISDNKNFSVGASAGLVMLSRHSGNISQVMQAADSACYIAKSEGGGRIHVYQPDDKALAKHTQNIHWAHRIQTALDKDQFKLYAQTIHSLNNPQEVLHEVLVRMTDDNGNIVPPASFIPVAERYHLIQAIDRWVIRKAFESIAKGWLHGGLCTINLSGDSIGDPGMLSFIEGELSAHSVDPQNVCFEITETAMVTNMLQATRFIGKLRGRGCKFALDDFGSGVSSFGYLQNLSVDILKIDGTLVRAIVDNKVNEVMVSSINTIGHTMNMKTVAEFVENEDIVKKLTDLGIDYGQGYYFSKPRCIEEHFRENQQRRCAG